jgi:uncharacterized membrane protein YcaP (DUF421 family)
MWGEAFFSGWDGLGRVVVVGVAAYAVIVVMLRISGKRTLSKLNAFDLIVTVALGSTLASILTSKSVALVEGIVALGLLIALQFVVTWTSVRWKWFDTMIKSEPAVLLRRGECIAAVMRRERVAADEVLAAIRNSGGRDFTDAEAVILETDGSITAILMR